MSEQLPDSPEAAQAVIGSILVQKDNLEVVRDILPNTRMFLDVGLRAI